MGETSNLLIEIEEFKLVSGCRTFDDSMLVFKKKNTWAALQFMNSILSHLQGFTNEGCKKRHQSTRLH
jgi:hypothetical protein